MTAERGRAAPAPIEVQRLRQKLAEYAMIVDLLTDLPRSRTQSEAIDALLDLAQELCAPTALGFVPAAAGGGGASVVRPASAAAVADVEATAAALGETQRWIRLGSNFAIAVTAGDQRCGVLAVVDVVVPQDIEEYSQLLLTMAGPLALVMVNAESRLALEASESNNRLLAENATDIVWRLDADSTMVWVSPSLESVLGWRPEQLLGTKPRELTHPDDQEVLTARRAELFAGGMIPDSDLRIRAADGSYRWMSVQVRPTHSDDAADSVDGVIVGLRDIHDQVLAREALERSENLFRVAMDGAPQGMAVVGLDLRFLQVNKALAAMLGRDEDWLLSHTLREVISPEDLDADLAGNGELITGSAQRIVREGRWLRADGSNLWVVHSTGLLRDENDVPLFHVSHIQDNTVAHERNAALAYRASHDPLTGLVNRDQLQQRITESLQFRPRRPGSTGVLYCDIDHFKAINDSHGHAAGDEVLQIVAGRMASVLRSGDTVARIGGDEFVAVLAQVYDLAAAATVAEKVRATVSQPVTLEDGAVIEIAMSIGAALASPEIDAHRLLRNADAALYAAKNAGRNQVRVFEHGTEAVLTRQVLADNAKAAEVNLELHRAMWDMSVEMLAVADTEGMLTAVSAGWQRILGYSPEELTSRPYLEFVHPDDLAATIEAAQALAEPGHEVVNFENRYRAKSGEYRWLSWSGQTSQDSQQVYCVVRDVTEQVAARQELERSNAALLQAQRIAQIGHWTLDLATNHVTWSAELFRMQGLDPDQDPPDYTEHSRLFTAESWQRLSEALPITQRTGIPYELELEMIRPDGSHGWMLARGEVACDAGGAVIGLQGVAMDVTKRRKATVDLVAAERRLRILADNTTDIVWERDADGLLVWVSGSVEAILGWTPAQLLGKRALDIVPPEDLEFTQANMSKLLSGEPIPLLEVRILTADGGFRWMALQARPLVDATGKVTGSVAGMRDIHDQVLTRRELERSNAALMQAQRIAKIGHWTLDLATDRVTWSDELFRMQGLDPAQDPPDYSESSRLFTAESWQRLSMALPITQETGVPYDLELEMVRPDGSHGWMLARGEVVRDATGTVAGLQGVAMDITEQKRAVGDQLAAEQRLRILAENATDVVWERDSQGVLVWVSESVEAILGWTPSELIGTRAQDLVPAEDLDFTNTRMANLFAGRPTPLGEVRLLTAAGEVRWMALQSRPLVDATGNVTGSVAGLRDVHDQVLARQDLVDSERRYRLLAENATDAVFLVDLAGVVEWVSPSIKAVLDLDADQVVGTDATALVHPDDLAQLRSVRASAAGGAPTTTFELRVRTGSGDYRWVSGSTGPVTDPEGNVSGRITTVRDVHQQVVARQALARSEETLRQAMEGASQGMALVGLDGRFLMANDALCQQVGLEWSQLGELAEDDLNPDDQAPHLEIYAQLVNGEIASNVHEGGLRSSDGTFSRVLHSLSLVRDSQQEPLYFVSQYQDIDALFTAREAAKASETRYRMLAENATDIVWQVSAHGILEWVSASVESVLGWSPEDLLGKDVTDLVHPDDRTKTDRGKAQIAAGEKPGSVEARMLSNDGSYRWVAVRGRPLAGPDDELAGYIVGMRDIDDEVLARAALSHALAHDPLTGLATLPTAIERIDELLAEIPEDGPGSWVGVLCIGVDSLRAVNEAITHSAGDLVLATLATRLADVQDDSDLLARGSGDEFIAILPGLSSGADAGALAEHIRLSTHGPITIGSTHFEPTVSIGIATGTIGSQGEALVHDASLAMHQAKDNGRDRCEFFLDSLAEEAQHRVQVEDGVRDGLLRGEFVPWFQPIVDLDDGRTVGYEALVRWIKSDGTVVAPGDFLPVAERTSLIVGLDLSVLAQAAATLSTLPAPLHVAVNVSAATLAHLGYARTVLRELEAAGADPRRLHLEFTETALLAAKATSSIRQDMALLADAGIKWYVDDFGTGYSSIAHLRDLPVAGLKLDLSFTAGLGSSDLTCEHLAKALAGLADGLGLDTVAEGVETPQQAAILRALGWEHGQGWLYGRPAPLE